MSAGTDICTYVSRMGVESGGEIRTQRPWWLRLDGLPPRAEERRRKVLERGFSPKQARRQIVGLGVLLAVQIAIFLGWTLFLWSQTTRVLLRTWLMFGVVALVDVWAYFRARKRIRGTIST